VPAEEALVGERLVIFLGGVEHHLDDQGRSTRGALSALFLNSPSLQRADCCPAPAMHLGFCRAPYTLSIWRCAADASNGSVPTAHQRAFSAWARSGRKTIRGDAFEFAVADSGIGVRESLRSCADYADLADDGRRCDSRLRRASRALAPQSGRVWVSARSSSASQT
jgi:hypothetical protein